MKSTPWQFFLNMTGGFLQGIAYIIPIYAMPLQAEGEVLMFIDELNCNPIFYKTTSNLNAAFINQTKECACEAFVLNSHWLFRTTKADFFQKTTFRSILIF